MLALALLIGLLIGGIQIAKTASYYPKSIRSGKTYAQLTEIGKVSPLQFLRGLIRPLPIRMVDGLFSTEITASVGLTGLLMAFLARDVRFWGALILFILLAQGGWLFRLTSKFQLRLPARWTYFAGLTLAVMATLGFSQLSLLGPMTHVLLLAQVANLLLIHPKLWPMEPFCQRWEKPSWVFREEAVARLRGKPRVQGLPYPLTTGQIHHIRTLGYSGGSQLKAMAWLRNDINPNGSGDHLGRNMDKDKLAWWMEGHPWSALEEAYGRQGSPTD